MRCFICIAVKALRCTFLYLFDSSFIPLPFLYSIDHSLQHYTFYLLYSPFILVLIVPSISPLKFKIFRLYELQARFEMADLDFVYTDCDTHAAELAELYTYSEIDDWALNVHAFRNYADSKRVILFFFSFVLKVFEGQVGRCVLA